MFDIQDGVSGYLICIAGKEEFVFSIELFENTFEDWLDADLWPERWGGRRGGDDLEAQAVFAGLQGFRHIEDKRRHPECFEFFSVQGRRRHHIHLAEVEPHLAGFG